MGLLLRLPFVLVQNLLLLLFYPLLYWRRTRAAPRAGWLELEIDKPIREITRRRSFFSRQSEAISLHRLRELVECAQSDGRVRGILLSLKEFRGGLSTATSLRDVIAQARAARKVVVVHLPNGCSTLGYYVACAADRIVLGEGTELSALGFSVATPYLKKTLTRSGVEPEVLAVGRYKTAGEALTESHMSAAQREQLDALLDGAFQAFLEAVSVGRRLDPERARELIDQGPYAAKEALSAGLIDQIAFDDQLDEVLEGRPLAERSASRRVPAASYLSRRTLRFKRLFRRPRIGVINVWGNIGPKAIGLVPMAAEDEIKPVIKGVRDDPTVKGVLCVINSRGGSALASERLRRELWLLAQKKPVTVYFADVAASGGYMIGTGAPLIVAQPTAITGSIGVIAARFVLDPLLARFEVSVERLSRGRRAQLYSPFRRLSEEERGALMRLIQGIYQRFVRVVAEARGRDEMDILPLAEGRVYTGREAFERGLVDRMGGFDVALSALRSQLGPLGERLEPELIEPRLKGLRRVPFSPTALAAVQSTPSFHNPLLAELALERVVPAALSEALALALSLPEEAVWAWSPEADLGLSREPIRSV